MKKAILIVTLIMGLCGTSLGMFSQTSEQHMSDCRHDAYLNFMDGAGNSVRLQIPEAGTATADRTGLPDWLMRDLQYLIMNNNVPDNSIANLEQQFLGEGKDIAILTGGYQALKERRTEENFMNSLDDSLRQIYTFAPLTGKPVCRDIAERYKIRAVSKGLVDDYLRSAFWFRMLYAIGNDSYLGEYNDMIEEAERIGL